MERVPLKVQLWLVALGYALVLGFAGLLIVWRTWQYKTHAADVAASGGMWAGGDLVLEMFICAMLLGMTFLLVVVIFRDEAAYAIYSKVVLAISVTLPVSVGLIAIPTISEVASLLGWACLFRVFASPVVLMGLVMSRLFARFAQARRFTNYALAVEGLTLVLMFALLFSPFRFHRG